MSRNSVDHTGPDTKAGGVPAGFINVAHQIFTEGAVNHDPIAAATKQIPIHKPTHLDMRPLQLVDMRDVSLRIELASCAGQ